MDKRRIMVVDDEEDFLQITRLNLMSTGRYEVKILSNAADIVRHAREFRPDVILLDLLMPVVGGLDACEMLNGDPAGKKTPIIILSALDKETDKLKAFKLGVIDYLTKPIQVDKLISAIEKALKYK